MNNNKNIGVISEQGFVAGMGLGFNPLKENELNPDTKIKKISDDEKDNQKNPSNKK